MILSLCGGGRGYVVFPTCCLDVRQYVQNSNMCQLYNLQKMKNRRETPGSSSSKLTIYMIEPSVIQTGPKVQLSSHLGHILRYHLEPNRPTDQPIPVCVCYRHILPQAVCLSRPPLADCSAATSWCVWLDRCHWCRLCSAPSGSLCCFSPGLGLSYMNEEVGSQKRTTAPHVHDCE